jgi:hypothetical protein
MDRRSCCQLSGDIRDSHLHRLYLHQRRLHGPVGDADPDGPASPTHGERQTAPLRREPRIDCKLPAPSLHATVIPQPNDYFDLDQGLAGALAVIWINVGDASP